MRKEDLCTLTYSFIFLFLGSMVIDSYLPAALGYIMAILSLLITISTYKDFTITLASDMVVFSVQFAIIFVIGTAETGLMIYMLVIYNTLMFEALKNMSNTSAKHVVQMGTFGTIVELLLLVVVSGIACTLLEIDISLVYQYLPIFIMLFFPMVAYSVYSFIIKTYHKKSQPKMPAPNKA